MSSKWPYVSTRAAEIVACLSMVSLADLVERHRAGDWGDVPKANVTLNADSGKPVVSRFPLALDLYVTTEDGLTVVTTVMPAPPARYAPAGLDALAPVGSNEYRSLIPPALTAAATT